MRLEEESRGVRGEKLYALVEEKEGLSQVSETGTRRIPETHWVEVRKKCYRSGERNVMSNKGEKRKAPLTITGDKSMKSMWRGN